MRPGWERDRPRFSDVKLHPEPFFVNRLRPYVLKAGLGVEKRELRLALADGRCVEKVSPLEHRRFHILIIVCARVLQGRTHYW